MSGNINDLKRESFVDKDGEKAQRVSLDGFKGTYAVPGDLPSTGNTIGDLASVQSPLGLYQWTGSAWNVFTGGGGGSGDMLKADNLSGLANYETARANLGIIDDITPSLTKAYSSDKTQAMHNAQAQAIQNLSGGGSQCEPLQDYQGTAIIGVLGTYVFDSSKTGTKYSLTSDSIPVGSNLIVELRKNSYKTGNVLSSTLQIATTDTLTNGKKTVSITDSDAYVAGDYVVAYLTSVGSTTPALNPYFTLTVS